MAKVILEFDIYEEQDAYQNALSGTKYLGILQEFDNYLRNRLKYEELPSDVHTALSEARARLHEEAEGRGASIWN